MRNWHRCTVFGVVAAGLAVGCQSNPYRPTLFQRFHGDPPGGPALGTPTDGPYIGGEVPAGSYPIGTQTYPGAIPPPNAPPPVSFPQSPPTAPPTVQGPAPRTTTTSGQSN